MSTPPELNASPTISQSLAAVVLAPLVPLDDGGPQPPTGTGGAGLGDDLAALGVLVVGGLATYWLWRRGHNRAVVGGGIALTMLLAAVVIAVPVALAEDPPPSSSVRLRPTSVDVTVAPAKAGTATAQCPAGSVIVGGGARTTLTAADGTTVPVSDEAALLLSASKPTANGWEATATAPSDAGVRMTLTSLALCTTDDGVDSLLVTAAPLQVAADTAERAQARCPEGHPLAIGWTADQAQPVAALPLAESASVTSWAGSEPTSTTASALCTTPTSTVHVVRYDGSAVLIDPDGHGAAEAVCPEGQQAVGGGFVAAASVGGRISRVAVLEATPSAERYSVKAASVKSGGGVLLTAYALCVPTS